MDWSFRLKHTHTHKHKYDKNYIYTDLRSSTNSQPMKQEDNYTKNTKMKFFKSSVIKNNVESGKGMGSHITYRGTKRRKQQTSQKCKQEDNGTS